MISISISIPSRRYFVDVTSNLLKRERVKFEETVSKQETMSFVWMDGRRNYGLCVGEGCLFLPYWSVAFARQWSASPRRIWSFAKMLSTPASHPPHPHPPRHAVIPLTSAAMPLVAGDAPRCHVDCRMRVSYTSSLARPRRQTSSNPLTPTTTCLHHPGSPR